VRRRESTPLLEKIKTDVSITKLKLNSNNNGNNNNSSTIRKEDKLKEVKEDTPIMKYITSQVYYRQLINRKYDTDLGCSKRL
jgi:hypothetical protein